MTYDALGRVTSSTDASSATTTTAYGLACAPAGTKGDLACYTSTTTIDASKHQSLGLSDALGRAIYAQSFTGTGPYTLYRTTTTHYDVLGQVVETDEADGTHQATATYDGLKHQTAFTDPDLGAYNMGYDPNGNRVWSIDPRGASGTLYQGYDGLNRLGWTSTHSDGSSPLATATYDSTASGNQGKGRLTSETFASGPSQSVTGGYAYTYDARGRQTGWTMTLGSTSYPFSTGYNDAGQATSLTYPDGDVVTTNYGAQDWLSGVSEAKGGTTNTLLNTVSYTGANGASMLPTSASVGNGVYAWNLSYDTDLRLSETKATQVSTSAVLFDQTRGFDAVGNVTSTNTTVAAGTDHQAFCYDEQNRLVWAGAKGTPSCSVSLTPGTLTAAQYTQTYAYDTLNRLTTGPKGSGYTYGDSNHLDAVTSAPSYSASYDAAGDMTGRSGNVLGYNAVRQLITWQNQATNPTQTASYAYDGSGERVQQSVTSGGTTTTTSYIGGDEEVSVTGGTTTTTKYYNAGLATVVNTNGTLTYLVADTLGSVSQALTAAGGVQATSLYTPYGSGRYTNGTMPTSYGYTKMRQDPSGLNYDHARYYDASVGQFVSADAKQGPNRYGYVAGNPETLTDPTGNYRSGPACPDGDCSVNRPTRPTTTGSGGSTQKLPTSCGLYISQAQCDQAKDAKEAAVKAARIQAGLWQFLVTILNGALDLYNLRKDFSEASKPDPNRAFNIAKDIAGIIGDVGTLLESIGNLGAGLLGDNGLFQGLRTVGATLGQIGSAVKFLINGYQAAPGFWQGAAKWTLALGLAGLSVSTGAFGTIIGTVLAIGSIVTGALGVKWEYVAQAGLSAAQFWAADQGTHADDLDAETPFGFCTSSPTPSGCPAL